MEALGFTLFDTALGTVGVAWSAAGIVSAALPEADRERQLARFRRRHPEVGETAPPEAILPVISAVQALLAGEKVNLSDAPLDLEAASPFERQVYALALAIPPGATRTYGDLAADLGDKALSRQVGQALGRNPVPPIVACHRILAAGGKTGGFSAPGGVTTKFRLLEIERAHAVADDLFAGTGGLAFQPKGRG